MKDDTIKLLRETSAGIKMAIDSLSELVEHVENENLRGLIFKSVDNHLEIRSSVRKLLEECRDEEKEPAVMAKVMSHVKTSVKLELDESDEKVAELITDGCDMGVKSLYKYIGEYRNADEEAKKITQRLNKEEETLIREVEKYL